MIRIAYGRIVTFFIWMFGVLVITLKRKKKKKCEIRNERTDGRL